MFFCVQAKKKWEEPGGEAVFILKATSESGLALSVLNPLKDNYPCKF